MLRVGATRVTRGDPRHTFQDTDEYRLPAPPPMPPAIVTNPASDGPPTSSSGPAARSRSARPADAGDLSGSGVHRHRGDESAGASGLFAAQSELSARIEGDIVAEHTGIHAAEHSRGRDFAAGKENYAAAAGGKPRRFVEARAHSARAGYNHNDAPQCLLPSLRRRAQTRCRIRESIPPTPRSTGLRPYPFR